MLLFLSIIEDCIKYFFHDVYTHALYYFVKLNIYICTHILLYYLFVAIYPCFYFLNSTETAVWTLLYTYMYLALDILRLTV